MERILVILSIVSVQVVGQMAYITPSQFSAHPNIPIEFGYHISPNGDNNDSGIYSEPWATLNFAFNQLTAGDTLYVHGGTYSITKADSMISVNNHDGTEESPIKVYNYPGELPVIDLSGLETTESYRYGMRFLYCDWWEVKGLRIRKVPDLGGSAYSEGLAVGYCGNMLFENMEVDSCGRAGIVVTHSTDTMYLVNCDSHHNGTGGSEDAQENGDGIITSYADLGSSFIFLTGCRSWSNTDDGFDCWDNEGHVSYHQCWSFNNGDIGLGVGDGNGFKLGTGEATATRRVTNCIAAGNYYNGFDPNWSPQIHTFYNNAAYDNDIGMAMDQSDSDILRNNLSYNNNSNSICDDCTDDHNSWNGEVTVTDADFLSVNYYGLDDARQSNGNLPTITFLHLAEGSDLIDAGVDIGLSYNGTAPDIGAYESDYE